MQTDSDSRPADDSFRLSGVNSFLLSQTTGKSYIRFHGRKKTLKIRIPNLLREPIFACVLWIYQLFGLCDAGE